MSARANTTPPEANREKRQELARLRHEANLNKQPPFSRPPGPATGSCNGLHLKSKFLGIPTRKGNSPIRLRMKIFVWILYVLAFVIAIGIGDPYGLGLILLLGVLCPGSSRGSFGGL